MLAPEWRRVLALSLLVTGLVAAPEAWAQLHPPAEWAFRGSFWEPADAASYWAAMREAATGASWTVHNRLTPEPHEPVLVYALYVILARASSALQVPLELAYGVLLNLSRVVLLLALYALVACFVARPARWTAFAMAVGSGGFAFLVLLLAALGGDPALVEELAPEWKYVEVNTFLALFSYPHLMLAVAAMALVVRFRWSLDRGLATLPALGLAASLLLLALANPFSLVPVGLALGAHGLLRWLARRRPAPADLAALGLFAGLAGPFLVYSSLTFVAGPFWGVLYGTQNLPHLVTPPVPALLAGFGLLAPLALLGAGPLLRRAPSGAFLLLWLGLALALMLAPLPFQRRLGLGLHPLLALAAFFGLEAVARSHLWRALPALARRLATYGLVTALGSSALAAYLMVLLAPLGRGPLAPPHAFERAAVVEAARWLAERVRPSDVLLADWRTSNTMLRFIAGRAVWGHPIATLDPGTKRAEVQAFYDPATTEPERLALLRRYTVSIVVWGPHEALPGASPADPGPYLVPIYENGEVRIYRVTPETLREAAPEAESPAGSLRRGGPLGPPRGWGAHAGTPLRVFGWTPGGPAEKAPNRHPEQSEGSPRGSFRTGRCFPSVSMTEREAVFGRAARGGEGPWLREAAPEEGPPA